MPCTSSASPCCCPWSNTGPRPPGPWGPRPRAPAPSKLLEPWYRKKNFVLSHEAAHEELLWGHGLADTLVEGFEFLLPYYEYILAVSADPDPRSPEA